jgi:hypothetical protein
VYPVAAGQHFLNGSALGWIQQFAGGRVSRGFFFRHDWRDGILSASHVAYGRKFRCDCLASGELPSRFVLLSCCDLELAAAMPLVEVVAHLAVGEVAHATPQGVAHDLTFVGNGLTLEAAVLGKGDSFLRPHTRIRHLILLQCCGALPGLCNNAVGLVAKVSRDFPMSGKYLGRRENILFVAGVVGGNLRGLGLINARGADALYQRIVFPLQQGECIVNLYGRSIGSAFAHRFLPGSKGGLYAWEKVRNCSEVVLVEGLFDYAVLRQAGFFNVTCSLGTHLNDTQLRQLCEGERTVYIAFDVDRNQSGQHAAEQLAHLLITHGISARRVPLPDGHDPNSFFVEGGDAPRFQSLLEAAQP